MRVLTRQVAIYLIVGAAIGGLAIGGAIGWTANGWRLSGNVEKLAGVVSTQDQSIATLKGVNDRCAASVGDVKASVKALLDESAKRSAAAQDAMDKAAKKAEGHLAAAAAALNRPMPAPGKECDAIVREALDYAKKRKGQS
jgi:hypothetical protein